MTELAAELPHSGEKPAAPKAKPTASFRPRMRGVLLSLGVVALVSLLIYLRFLAPADARVHRVERGEVLAQAFGRGTIESKREAQVGFDLVGRLSEVLVEEGTRVTLGQELARLYPEQVSADLRAASTGVAAARTSLSRLAAEEQRVRTTLESEEREAERARALGAHGAIPQHELDLAQDAVKITRAELDRVLAQRAEATRSIDVAQGGVAQRRVTVLRATLLAPFDGLVTRRLREPGDTVAVGTTVLRIVDTEQVYLRAWIDETVLSDLKDDQPAQIVIPGSGRSLMGRVTRVGWESDRQTHELLVDVTPSESLGRIAIGQRADVWITTKTADKALRVPTEFIQRDADGPFCNVDREGRVSLVRVQLGVLGRELVEVTDGLKEGDLVLAPTKPGAVLRTDGRWKKS
jgi:HlyD family secretion protein